ncbi:MAG: Nif11-like leader peptide family RiPP precursor [Pseudomonadota bacterium]
MINQSVEKFRELVSEDSSLQPAFLEAFAKGPAALAQLAKQHGFDVSPAEVDAALAEISENGELSDFELELVSGGVIRGSTLSLSLGTGTAAVAGALPQDGVNAGPAYSSGAVSPPPPPPPSSGGGK